MGKFLNGIPNSKYEFLMPGLTTICGLSTVPVGLPSGGLRNFGAGLSDVKSLWASSQIFECKTLSPVIARIRLDGTKNFLAYFKSIDLVRWWRILENSSELDRAIFDLGKQASKNKFVIKRSGSSKRSPSSVMMAPRSLSSA